MYVCVCVIVLKFISVNKRGDDSFGLDVQSNTIGGFPYTVDGNRLSVDVGTKSNKFFDIEDPDVWKWLIIKNPLTRLDAYKEEDNEPTPAFREYIRIAKLLRLLDHAQHAAAANGKTLSKAIQKYKLLLKSNQVREGN